MLLPWLRNYLETAGDCPNFAELGSKMGLSPFRSRFEIVSKEMARGDAGVYENHVGRDLFASHPGARRA